MSSQTVTGLGLQFTDDNKHAYAYSGVITDASSAANSTALLFTTQSEYLEAKLSITNDEASTAAIFIEAFFNDIKIMDIISDVSGGSGPYLGNPFYLLIPPFTKFELKVGANSSVDFTAWITAKVGMAPRVGN